MSGTTVRKEDRLFSLILALSATRDGLTKGDIYRSVHGYVERFNHDTDQTLDKLFERDKKDLRDMGVVIKTFELAGDEGQTHNIRYAITPDEYKLPSDIEFSPQEMSYLQLSSAVWRELALSVDARHALTKLRSLGIQADGDLTHIAPRIGAVERAFTVITEALENELILEFSYAKPGESSPGLRRAAPLGLAQWHDRWYVLAFDFEAQAERTFLLARIRGSIRHVPQQNYPRPRADYASQLVNDLDAIALANAVTVHVQPGSEAIYLLQRWGATDQGEGMWSVPSADIELLADELFPYVTTVKVVEPAALRDALLRRLQLILDRASQHE